MNKKTCLCILFAVCVVALIIDSEAHTAALALLVIAVAGFLVVLPFWLFGFLIVCVFDGPYSAWREFNPAHLVKEMINESNSDEGVCDE